MKMMGKLKIVKHRTAFCFNCKHCPGHLKGHRGQSADAFLFDALLISQKQKPANSVIAGECLVNNEKKNNIKCTKKCKQGT